MSEASGKPKKLNNLMDIWKIKGYQLMLIFDKVDFRAKKISKIKGIQGLYISEKESIQQESIIILNMYTPNNKISKYLKQK